MTDAEHLINRVVSAWNGNDAGAVASLHAPDSTVTDTGIAPPARGSDQILARAQMYIDGIGDLEVVPSVTTGSAEFVAYEWRVKGFHAGPLMGASATGRPIDVPGTTMFELDSDGLIFAERLYWNLATLIDQISHE
jgi:steroid delta-isomerase-like uncharacterized protein